MGDARRPMANAGESCRFGKCECLRCACGYAAGSPGCTDYHERHPYSRVTMTDGTVQKLRGAAGAGRPE